MLIVLGLVSESCRISSLEEIPRIDVLLTSVLCSWLFESNLLIKFQSTSSWTR